MNTTLPFSILTGNSQHVCTSSWQRGNVYDDHHRVYICLRGAARICVANRWVPLRGAQVYFIPGYRTFAHRCDQMLRLHWFHFRANDPLVEADLASISSVVSWPLSQWRMWNGEFQSIDTLLQKPDDAQLQYRFQSLLMMLLARLQTAPRNPDRQHVTQADMQRLTPAMRYMEQHFLENPPLSLVAAQAHLSLVHFHRLFRKHYRISPHRYMLRLRMESAYHLLLRGGCSAKEVGAQTGYPSYAYFSRAFLAYFRRCPSDVLARRALPMP